MKGEEFVMSARALGAGPARILLRHVLPNVLTPVIVAAALGVGRVILLEAGLSYLGVGLHPPDPSWGNIIQDGTDQDLRNCEYMVDLFLSRHGPCAHSDGVQ
jgi:peptide/nickel transport system permease protein